MAILCGLCMNYMYSTLYKHLNTRVLVLGSKIKTLLNKEKNRYQGLLKWVCCFLSYQLPKRHQWQCLLGLFCVVAKVVTWQLLLV